MRIVAKFLLAVSVALPGLLLARGACAQTGVQLYVSSTGSGTACTSAAPCTLDQAVGNVLGNNWIWPTINLAAGTYTADYLEGGIDIQDWPFGVSFVGVGVNQTTVQGTSGCYGVFIADDSELMISKMTVKGTGCSMGIWATDGGTIFINGNLTISGNVNEYAIYSETRGLITDYSLLTISANGEAGITANATGAVVLVNTLTYSGSPSYSIGAMQVIGDSNITLDGAVSGTVTGYQYAISLNGSINTGITPADNLPGSEPGITATGGQIN